MQNTQTSRRERRRTQHGNAVLEFALIMFPFFALIFGIMNIAGGQIHQVTIHCLGDTEAGFGWISLRVQQMV